MPSWQIVCHVNKIPRPGDYETFDLGPESVFVVRDKDGSIERSTKRVPTSRRPHSRWIRHLPRRRSPAPTTAGATGTTASLSRRADARDLPGTRSCRSTALRPVRVDTASASCSCASPGTRRRSPGPGPRSPRSSRRTASRTWCRSRPITTDIWNVDWKIAMDNYLESYHVPIGHPGLYRMFTPDYEDRRSAPGDRPRHELDARAALLALVRSACYTSTRRQRPRTSRRRTAAAGASTAALPNLGIDMYPDQMDFFQLLPGGPGTRHHPRRGLRRTR